MDKKKLKQQLEEIACKIGYILGCLDFYIEQEEEKRNNFKIIKK